MLAIPSKLKWKFPESLVVKWLAIQYLRLVIETDDRLRICF